MASTSEPSSAFLASAIAASALDFTSAETLSPSSLVLGGVAQAVGLVADLDLFLLLLVLLGMSLGVLDHTIDFVVGQSSGAGDGNLLLLAGALVLSGDLDGRWRRCRGDLDLRHAAAGDRDTGPAGTYRATCCRGSRSSRSPWSTLISTLVWLSATVE